MKKLFVIALAGALVMAFSAAAFAAPTVTISTRINQEFGWHNKSKELNNSDDDVTNVFVPLVGNSYLRGKFMSEDKKVGAMSEIALKSDNVTLRHAFGWYKMGNCTFLAGQTDNWHGSAPGSWSYQKLSESPGGGDLLGWGKAWLPRNPKLQVTWASGMFGVQASLEKPRSTPISFGTTGVDQYSTFPGITVSVDIKTKMFEITPSAMWMRWEAEGTASGVDDSIDAFGFILPLGIRVAGFKLLAELHYAKNPSTIWSGYSAAAPVMKADGSFEDGDLFGGYVELSYGMGALTIAAGVGVENISNDAWKDSLGYNDDNFTRVRYYLVLPYKAHKYLTIRPEFNYNDHGDNPADGKDGGNEWLIGVLFRFII